MASSRSTKPRAMSVPSSRETVLWLMSVRCASSPREPRMAARRARRAARAHGRRTASVRPSSLIARGTLQPPPVCDSVFPIGNALADRATYHRAMSYLMTCPQLRRPRGHGLRASAASSPAGRASAPTPRELGAYNYFRRNVGRRPARVVVAPLRAAVRGSSPSATPAPTTCTGRRWPTRRPPREPAPGPARRAHRPRGARRLHLRRQARRGARGRHHRLRPLRQGPAHVLALLQVPPPARTAVLRRAVPQLPGGRRRRPRRACVHRARARGHGGSSTSTPPPASSTTSWP